VSTEQGLKRVRGVSIRRIPAGHPGAGIAVVRVHYSADPTMDEGRIEVLRSKYTSDARWRREMEIEYEALEGQLLYGEFNREKNVVSAFDVSDREKWTIYMGLDPHPRTAHAMVWEAFNGRGDRAVCGELWPEFGTRYGPTDGIRWKTSDYAEAIQLFESDSESKPEPFEWARGKRLSVRRRFMDTYGRASNSDEGEDYFETYRNLGVKLTKKAIVAGKSTEEVNLHFETALKGEDNLSKAYDGIARALMSRKYADGETAPPAMVVFRECIETIDEFENVRFPEEEAETLRDEKPVTYRKHCLDCLAYIETARPGFAMPRREVKSEMPQELVAR